MLIGYARTSQLHQRAGLEGQIDDLKAIGCERLFVEQVSALAHRPELQNAIGFARDGDTLVVKRMCRLARSTVELLNIVAKLEAKGVGVRVLDFGGGELDTKSASGRLLITVLAAVSEAERSMMLERQRVGIAKAKQEGRYKGRVPTARRKASQVKELRRSGLGATQIASQLGISRASVYRILAEAA
ncbi:recombinase family protein [Novosphingobium sp.]|uniref:recombinase family protein n=1 Tax=Novosphingobium sp. TaxID=1874826 RepID=UPI0025EC7EAE|nr:recombinase family protein [Novosphingobium sp.]MCC6925122.1 recombinase family protein [Novosphingobium sp.]